jgi:hypothetical protein
MVSTPEFPKPEWYRTPPEPVDRPLGIHSAFVLGFEAARFWAGCKPAPTGRSEPGVWGIVQAPNRSIGIRGLGDRSGSQPADRNPGPGGSFRLPTSRSEPGAWGIVQAPNRPIGTNPSSGRPAAVSVGRMRDDPWPQACSLRNAVSARRSSGRGQGDFEPGTALDRRSKTGGGRPDSHAARGEHGARPLQSVDRHHKPEAGE